MKHETFLIVIPCEEVTPSLKKTLTSIHQQTYTHWQVIAILTQGTEKKLSKVTFIVDQKTLGNPSQKRNYTLKYRHFDYVLFLDDDVVLDRYFIEKAIVSLKQKNVSAVVGPLITPISSPFWEKISDRIWESELLSLKYSPQKDRFNKETFVSDYSCAALVMKLSDFKKIGGFSEKFFPGEDTKLCLDITQKLGKKIIRSEKMIAYHRRRPFPFGFLRQISHYGFQRGRFAILFPQTSLHVIYLVSFLSVAYGMGIVISLLVKKYPFFWMWLPFPVYLFLLSREVAIVYAKEKKIGLALFAGTGIFLTHIVYGIQFGRGVVVELGRKLI